MHPKICTLEKLKSLHLNQCEKLKQLPENIGQLASLKTLNLQECSNLQSLPESLGEMDSLEQLDLSGCGALRRMPYLIKWPNIFSLFLPIKCEVTRLPKKIDLGPLREISTPGLFSFHETSLPVALQKLSMWEAENIEFNKDWVNLESLVIGKFKPEKLSTTMGRLLSLKELTIC